MNRRELCVALSALATMTQSAAVAQSDARAKKEPVLSRQMTFAFDQMPASSSAFGVTREVIKGVLPTGEYVGLHETTLLPGFMPHPDHKHRHSEFMLMREGTIEFNNDGTRQRVGPGDVIFAASGVMHGWRNIGTVPAKYFVLTVGRDT
ncbi:MAG TPA: cupin domain-containing protein [Terracidiphilus sp.]|jgi:quercetin dioxygenase-like cupin family protein